MKGMLKKWLGIWDAEYRITAMKETLRLQNEWIVRLQTNTRVLEEGFRKLAGANLKTFAVPDHLPTPGEYLARGDYAKAMDAWNTRKAESDRIGEAALKRLAAEDAARRHSAPLEEPDVEF